MPVLGRGLEFVTQSKLGSVCWRQLKLQERLARSCLQRSHTQDRQGSLEVAAGYFFLFAVGCPAGMDKYMQLPNWLLHF